MIINKQNIKTITIITIATILFMIALSGVNAANTTIDENNPYGILGAINNVDPNDTVFLTPGTYNKTNNDTNITINKNVTIKGNGSTDRVKIDALGQN